jgi:hypothetical protein
MLSTRQFTFLLYSAFLLFQSCTIEKRRYTSGYHITRNGQKQEIVLEPKTQVIAPSEYSSSSFERADSSRVTPAQAILDHHLLTPKDSLENHIAKTADRAKHNCTAFVNTTKGIGPIRRTWSNQFPSSINSFSKEEEEGQEKSILAYLTMFITLLAILTLLIASFVATGWASLGYFILSIMIAVPACILGIIALATAQKNNRRIPVAFYPFFILSCVATLGLIVILITK